jgi:Flp pilus assembly protein TadB
MTPEVITQFLQNQGEQIKVERKNQEIQSREQDIRLREVETTNTYSLAALDAQVQDRENARKHELAMKRSRYRHWILAAGAGTVVFIGALGLAAAYSQTALAMDIVKMVVPPTLTAVSGYFLGINRGKTAAKEDAAEVAAQK